MTTVKSNDQTKYTIAVNNIFGIFAAPGTDPLIFMSMMRSEMKNYFQGVTHYITKYPVKLGYVQGWKEIPSTLETGGYLHYQYQPWHGVVSGEVTTPNTDSHPFSLLTTINRRTHHTNFVEDIKNTLAESSGNFSFALMHRADKESLYIGTGLHVPMYLGKYRNGSFVFANEPTLLRNIGVMSLAVVKPGVILKLATVGKEVQIVETHKVPLIMKNPGSQNFYNFIDPSDYP